MEMIVTTGKHSYLINNEELAFVEVGSTVFIPEENKMYMVLEPSILTEIGAEVLSADTLEELIKALAAGGEIAIVDKIDAPTGFIVNADTSIVNNAEITLHIF